MGFRTLAGPASVSLATYLAISLFNAYVLILFFEGDLTLYIHPRYVLFTVVLNVASLAACSAGFVLAARRATGGFGAAAGGALWRPSLTFVVAALVLAAAYVLPASTLSSGTADQRSDNLNTAGAPSADDSGTLAAFDTGSTPTLSDAATADLAIDDWTAAFGAEPSPGFYEDKEVDVVGFVFRPDGVPQDVFYVSRFVVTCCAVDAQPIGLPVRYPGWEDRFEEDAWVRVEGSFAEAGEGVSEPAVVEPGRISPTEEPQNPYVN